MSDHASRRVGPVRPMRLRLAPRRLAAASPVPSAPVLTRGERAALACLLVAVGLWASWWMLLRSRIWDYLTDADYLGAGMVFLVFLLAAVAVGWGTPERLVWLTGKLRQDLPPDAREAAPAPALMVVTSSQALARPTARGHRPRTRRRDQDWDDRWPR